MKKLIRQILLVIALFVSLIVYTSTNKDGYQWYYLIPLVYSLYIYIDKQLINRLLNNAGYTIFFVASISRYVLLPLILCLSGYQEARFSMLPSAQLYKQAVFLMLYEEIVVLTAFLLFSRYFYEKKSFSTVFTGINMRSNKFLKIFILFSIFIALLYPIVFIHTHFITTIDQLDVYENDNEKISGFLSIPIDISRLLIVFLIIKWTYKRYCKTHKLFYIIFSIAAVIINSCFVNQISRFGLLIPLVAFTYLLSWIYYHKRKYIYQMMFIFACVGIIFMSAIKFFGIYRNVLNDSADDIAYWGPNLNAYLMGPQNIAIGIATNDRVNSIYGDNRLVLILNDTFTNIAGLSGYIPSQITSNNVFNYTFHPEYNAVDQICPNIINGYFYFGTYFAPIQPLLFLILFMLFDSRARRQQEIGYRYIYNYAAVTSGLFMMINESMIYSMLFNVAFMAWLVIRIDEFFEPKKIRKQLKLS